MPTLEDKWMPMKGKGFEQVPSVYKDVSWTTFPHASHMEIHVSALQHIIDDLFIPSTVHIRAMAQTDRSASYSSLPDASGTTTQSISIEKQKEKKGRLKQSGSKYTIELYPEPALDESKNDPKKYVILLNKDAQRQASNLYAKDRDSVWREYRSIIYDEAICLFYILMILGDLKPIAEAFKEENKYIFGSIISIAVNLTVYTYFSLRKKDYLRVFRNKKRDDTMRIGEDENEFDEDRIANELQPQHIPKRVQDILDRKPVATFVPLFLLKYFASIVRERIPVSPLMRYRE